VLFCLKSNIFITAGHRPAESKTTKLLPERQDFCGTSPVFQAEVVVLYFLRISRPAVMKILPFGQPQFISQNNNASKKV
jgi:hypothetical protein